MALLDRPNATLLDITRMLTDADFRKETLDYCKDATVLQFWKKEFGQWGEKQINEAIAPVLNKVGAFTANPIVRNILGQPESSFNIRKIMDEGKILVVNLSKGLIGEDNASLLGSFLVTKIQLAAMSRSDIDRIEDRRPFYLYVDEFQNFATDSFAVILSEARKYGLNLTVANQYVSQMTDSVKNAVFGNVGSMISFRVSVEDAPVLAKQFEPQFDAQDLIQMNNRHFVINMVIKGEKTPAFSAKTLDLPKPINDFTAKIIENTRRRYGKPKAVVEKMIADMLTPPPQLQTKRMAQIQGFEYTAQQIKENVFAPVKTNNKNQKTNAANTEIKPMFQTEKISLNGNSKPLDPKKVSPNSLEQKEPSLGLKDLSKAMAEKGIELPPQNSVKKKRRKPRHKSINKASSRINLEKPTNRIDNTELKIERN